MSGTTSERAGDLWRAIEVENGRIRAVETATEGRRETRRVSMIEERGNLEDSRLCSNLQRISRRLNAIEIQAWEKESGNVDVVWDDRHRSRGREMALQRLDGD